MIDRTLPRNAACTLLCAGIVMLAGCNKAADSQAANPATAGSAPAIAGTGAQQAAPYTPPSADQLYQMVAPIALFPDKLVAQVLAGSTYPDQITAADNMLQQQPNLTGSQLADAVNPQPWDPSVKGLTQFPSVLDQMAQNITWTTALGEAYVNDPSDVMNAIQVMRQRAQSKGSLRSSAQMQVVSQSPAAPDDEQVVDEGEAQPAYDGPAEVPPPPQTIEILPAQPDTVYVPQYDPGTVYGEPVATYPGYTYAQPSGYSTGQIVAAGAIAFGVGIVVGALIEHHHDSNSAPAPNPGWGWNSWGMNWGRHGGGEGGYAGGGWQRPAVVHNNTVYVSRSTTVVNRYVTNNINNSRTVNYVNSNNRTVNNTTTNNNQVYNNNRYTNTTTNNRTVNTNVVNERQTTAGQRPATQAMTTPHFGTPVRGAEPARFEQARTASQPAARPAMNEAPREIARPAQPPRPEAAAVRQMPRAEPAQAAAPRPMEQRPAQPVQERPVQRPVQPAQERLPQPVQERPAQPMQERPMERPAQPAQERPPQPAQERPMERPAPQPMERAPERPAPQPQPRPEPQHPAAPPAPAHHEAPKPAPRKQDDNQH